MSDAYLRYVPTDPRFQPLPLAVSAAIAFLRPILLARVIEPQFKPAVVFVDAGGNWSGVDCPSCGADAEEWWSDAMSNAAASSFNSLELNAPCCGAHVSLNELRYGWPVAFGSFLLEAENPALPELSPSQLEELERLLGCRLHEIKAHL